MSLINKIKHTGSVTRRSSGDLSRLRVALCAFFALQGFTYASWAVRVPAIKTQTGASAAALGLALLGLSAGAVATMLMAGTLCRRFGSPRITVISGVLLCVTLPLPALAHSAVTLGLILAVFGIAFGCINVAMNSVAVDMVAALRRPIMPGFHAAWSFGGLAGAGIGGLLAPHLSPLRHLILIALVSLVVAAAAGHTLLTRAIVTSSHPASADPASADPAPADPAPADPAPADPAPADPAPADPAPADLAPSALSSHDPAGPASPPDRLDPGVQAGSAWRRALGTGRVVGLFGLIGLCAAYNEGAIGDWGALHLKQDLGASAGLAAAGYAVFALAEATGRLCGTALLERLGRTRVLVLGALTACAGMLVASLAPDVWLVLAGFAATGLGVANLFPAAVARAGLLAGSDGVALTSTLGYGGFLLGPPVIGFLASDFGLRAGLTTLSLLTLAAAVIAHASRHR